MKTETLLLYGGAAVAAYLLLGNNTSTAAPVVSPTLSPSGAVLVTNSAGVTTPTIPNAPTPPASYDDTYYKTYQYPALLATYPEIGNPNHVLSATEANNYLNNYLELQQWVQSPATIPARFQTQQQALQFHWNTYGVPYKYSFMPFSPPKNANWVPPPVVASAKKKGTSFGSILGDVGEAVGIAASVVAMAGVNEGYNDTEVELLLTGSGILLDILPMYARGNAQKIQALENLVKLRISQYA